MAKKHKHFFHNNSIQQQETGEPGCPQHHLLFVASRCQHLPSNIINKTTNQQYHSINQPAIHYDLCVLVGL
jgi:hypothetical protein